MPCDQSKAKIVEILMNNRESRTVLPTFLETTDNINITGFTCNRFVRAS